MFDPKANLNMFPLNTVIPGVYEEEIIIRNENGLELYKKTTTKTEADQFFKTNGKSIPGSGLLKAFFIPIRTDNIRDFAKDLFLPSFFYISQNINDIALKTLIKVGAIFLDCITFLPRLLTTPFRLMYNFYTVKEHPLIVFVKGNPEAKEAIKDGCFEICYKYREVKVNNNGINRGPAYNEILEKTTLVFTKQQINNRKKTCNNLLQGQILVIESLPSGKKFWRIISEHNKVNSVNESDEF